VTAHREPIDPRGTAGDAAPGDSIDPRDAALDAKVDIAVADEADAARADHEDGAHLPNIPLLADSMDQQSEPRPTWRGWIHAGTFPLAIVLGIVLISVAQGGVAKTASAIFMATSLLLFGNSALYHRFDWKPKTKRLLKRIDHANIFLLIAGTYTPLSLLALPPDKGAVLLSIVWGGALLSASDSECSGSAPRAGCTCLCMSRSAGRPSCISATCSPPAA
jgi:hemolysin III